jgi:hypothetical protein
MSISELLGKQEGGGQHPEEREQDQEADQKTHS